MFFFLQHKLPTILTISVRYFVWAHTRQERDTYIYRIREKDEPSNWRNRCLLENSDKRLCHLGKHNGKPLRHSIVWYIFPQRRPKKGSSLSFLPKGESSRWRQTERERESRSPIDWRYPPIFQIRKIARIMLCCPFWLYSEIRNL